MKAVLCRRAGPPEALELADLPDPVPAKGEAVVDIAAAALNFFDTLIIAGKYQYKPDFPFSPAAEFSGTVSAVGPGVTGFKVGDKVCGHLGFGAAREKLAVSTERLVLVPPSLDLDRAAGLFVTYGTTIHALADRAKIKPGETLAVLGAAGGTGLAAIELGKILGARVIACASSADKLEFCRQHGADDVIDYSKEDLKERLRELTGGKGADVVYDPVGGPYAEPALRSTAWEGRYLVIGFAAGEIPKIPLNLALLKGCEIVGVFWGEFIRRHPERLRAQIKDVLDWVNAGRLSAHVDAVYPFERAGEAFAAIGARKIKGKVLLKPKV
ncbi:MAG TPA: NADPH:quinone oxidoreductase family protein [Xanthobacteraceae bacterium]|nr:NADPH:quinone oxidoreductase family protein [Xanthobacteraceae bacterium]